MRLPHVAAFVATVAVAVPAGWHALTADITKDGPGTRPAEQELVVDGATVKVQLDRGIMMSGSQIKATLVATAETERDITLDVRALQDNGYGGERVPNPPTIVGKKTIKVHATPEGGTPTEVAFAMNGVKRKGAVGWYDLDFVKSKTKFKKFTWEADEGDADADPDAPAKYARVSFATWGGNSIPMNVDPVTVPASGPFEIAIHVKNTKKKALDYVDVTVGQRVEGGGLDGGMYLSTYENDGGNYLAEKIDSEDEDPSIAPGAERVFHYRITPNSDEDKKFTVAIHAEAGRDGALDVLTFERSSQQPAETPPIIGSTPGTIDLSKDIAAKDIAAKDIAAENTAPVKSVAVK
ncbi:MAG TPA: hypothetical protein VGM39_22325 [Kofleriaceae bacterium]|jgi:hypothetical protein